MEVTLKAAVESVDVTDFPVTLGEETVAVTSVELKEGTEATYVLTVASLDGKAGVLKVKDVESASFDFSEAALSIAINAVKAATSSNIIAALEAPVLGLTAIDSTLASDYVAEVAVSFVDTRALLQAAVDRVNTKAVADLQTKVDAVKNATGQAALLTALSDLGIAREINSLALAYFQAINAKAPATKADIQAIVDEVNLAEVEKLVAAAEATVTDASVSDASTLLGNFTGAVLDDQGADVAKTAFTARLAVVTEIVDVNDAAVVNAAALLAALKDATLALENVVDANDVDYDTEVQAAITADANFKFKTVAQLQAFVNDTNAKVAVSLITAVNDAANENDFLSALQASKLGLTGVAAGNKTAYFTAGKDVAFKTAADIQKLVDDVNAKAAEQALIDGINNATKSTIDAAVAAFVNAYDNEAFINVARNNRPEVIATFWVNHGEGRSEAFTSVAEVSEALTAAVAEYQGYLNAINAATTTTELRVAFNVMIDDLEAAYGNQVTSKVAELADPAVYANGNLTIDAATAIFEALEAKRASNGQFSTVAEAYGALGL